MIVYINDCSFSDYFKSEEDALLKLKQLAELEIPALQLSNLNPIRRTRSLADILILPNMTLRMFMHKLAASTKSSDKDIAALLLTFFVRGPYSGEMHKFDDTLTDENGICRKSSCIDEAVSHLGGAALLELEKPLFKSTEIFKSSRFGKKCLRKFSQKETIKQSVWHYQSNEKHEIKTDRNVNGMVHSAMKLNDSAAQKILQNGVLCGKSVFARINDQWYKFHRHTDNIYHGFPITPKTPPQDFSNALKYLNIIGENSQGQFFYEDFVPQ